MLTITGGPLLVLLTHSAKCTWSCSGTSISSISGHVIVTVAVFIIRKDFKQLPPATSKAPFIVTPSVVEQFDFRVLRENRRAVGEDTEEFHRVLGDVSWGEATQRVRDFIVYAYVRGASIGCADRTELEGNTSVFTKRRCRGSN